MAWVKDAGSIIPPVSLAGVTGKRGFGTEVQNYAHTITSLPGTTVLGNNTKRVWATLHNTGPGTVCLTYGGYVHLAPGDTYIIDKFNAWTGEVGAYYTDVAATLFVNECQLAGL